MPVEAGLDFYLDAGLAHPDEQYQPLPVFARAMGRDANYLGLLGRQGKLEAGNMGDDGRARSWRCGTMLSKAERALKLA
jgi:hypothetical protein